VTVLPDTDDPRRFESGSILWAEDHELVVRAARPYRDRGLIVAFAGIRDRTEAEALRGSVLTASGRRDLEEGEFWPDDLVGLEAVDPRGARLGTVTGVVVTGAQDRLVVTTPRGNEVEVPFVDDLVGDPEAGCIVIDPPGGLF
jgi:16S rRNA processing protein RimM